MTIVIQRSKDIYTAQRWTYSWASIFPMFIKQFDNYVFYLIDFDFKHLSFIKFVKQRLAFILLKFYLFLLSNFLL
jgi:hypothetical protein